MLAPALAELTSFLRKANRQLRQASLSALDVRAGAGRVDGRQGERCLLACEAAGRRVIINNHGAARPGQCTHTPALRLH